MDAELEQNLALLQHFPVASYYREEIEGEWLSLSCELERKACRNVGGRDQDI